MRNVIASMMLITAVIGCGSELDMNSPARTSISPILQRSIEVKEGPGDCAILAVAQVNRQLGLTSPTPAWTQEEHDEIAVELKTDMINGGTKTQDTKEYFISRGYNVDVFPLTNESSYSYLEQKINSGCVGMVQMVEDMESHIEAILSVEGNTIHTNSWGKDATITGFSTLNVQHSNMSKYFGLSAKIWALTICE